MSDYQDYDTPRLVVQQHMYRPIQAKNKTTLYKLYAFEANSGYSLSGTLRSDYLKAKKTYKNGNS